jgi:hypothetical protein
MNVPGTLWVTLGDVDVPVTVNGNEPFGIVMVAPTVRVVVVVAVPGLMVVVPNVPEISFLGSPETESVTGDTNPSIEVSITVYFDVPKADTPG